LKGGEHIFKAYQLNPSEVLEVVNLELMLFYVVSETSPNIKYSVSLNTYFCECASSVSTCKHILGVQRIVKEYFILPSTSRVSIEEYVDNVEPLSPIQMDAPIVDMTTEFVENDDQQRGLLDVLVEAETMIQELRSSIQTYSEEEVIHKKNLVQKFLTSLSEPFTFERPSTIDLPLRGSIASIQENVKRTRMGHGKKRVAQEDGLGKLSTTTFETFNSCASSSFKAKKSYIS
jgi:hypothetical protein